MAKHHRHSLAVVLLFVFLLAAGMAALLLHPAFFPKSFPGATGTLTMVSLSNPKNVQGMKRYVDLSKMDDDTWAADTAGEQVLMPYGLIYDVETGELRAAKGYGIISDSGLSFDRERRTYYGMAADPRGTSDTICTFTLEEGANEFPLEFRRGETLYTSEGAAVHDPLLAGGSLYFMESSGNAGSDLYRYDLNTKTKEKLAEDVSALYGVGSTGVCISKYPSIKTYTKAPGGEAELLAATGNICGRSSDGTRVLLWCYDDKGQAPSLAVYDCETGRYLAEVNLERSWGRLMTGALSPDARFAAACFETAPDRYRVRMIDLETGRQIPLFQDLDSVSAYNLDWS